MSAAECPASANNEGECDITPAMAFTITIAKFTSLKLFLNFNLREIQTNPSDFHTRVGCVL